MSGYQAFIEYQVSLIGTGEPISQADRDNLPGLADGGVPGEAAGCDDGGVGFENPIGRPVVAHELPDVLDRVQFGLTGQ
ncbi:hypothetical protein ACFOD4_00100 [Pseudoroseomonas globiformis]|uniref:Uncharacterized protein n=1 Tax=Teichococcus globiformis TaxID=2307229 RepID=A0ABV7FYH9_9PROT